MKLVLETGAGIPDANSYITNEDAIDGLPSGISAAWIELSTDEQIDRLAAASQFIDASFSWAGRRKSLEQGLSWPREGVSFEGMPVSGSAVPKQVKKACTAALLLIHSEGPEVFHPGAEQEIKKEKLGAMETEYFPSGRHDYKSGYESINNILKGFYREGEDGKGAAEVLKA